MNFCQAASFLLADFRPRHLVNFAVLTLVASSSFCCQVCCFGRKSFPITTASRLSPSSRNFPSPSLHLPKNKKNSSTLDANINQFNNPHQPTSRILFNVLRGGTAPSTKSMTSTSTAANGVSDAGTSSSETALSIGTTTGFPDSFLFHDHYGGVTIHLEQCNDEQTKRFLDPATFEQTLTNALQEWMTQGKKGIWIHFPIQHSVLIPIAASLKFDFHMVFEKRLLIMNRWLPIDKANKLPLGPTHQVGVGCLILCPWDHSKMLVVQEKTGPAASLRLWKMCTGLSDPGEDIHKAAERELWEETGLTAICQGITMIRQSHSTRSGTRASSDLFFVCQMALQLPDGYDPTKDDECINLFQACPDEIEAIRWISVEEYCNQEAWKLSPTMQELNRGVLQIARQQKQREENGDDTSEHSVFLLKHQTLPLGFGTDNTNTIYYFDNSRSNL